ncbi:FAS-associated factor 2-A-like [Octopus sinensis]|uniref:FAS-associated factor 2-A-like n=1 Tax=Octopus sinensis TaxID=2607531 RepID=A0A6P7SY88_9MOLL|nr:FAS-associated factor 2-A-like [Octopus sinensis]
MAAGKRTQKRQTASKRPAESTPCSSSVSCLEEDSSTHGHPKRIKSISSNQASDIYSRTLESAIKDSLKLSASCRKPLVLYLYGCDDDRLLKSKTVSEYLCNRFAVWARKLDTDENKKQTFSLLKKEFGSEITKKVKQYEQNRLPIVLVLGKVQCSLVILGELDKVQDPVKFQAFLESVLEVFPDMIRPEILTESLREERASLIREQDREYEESLKKDKEKEQQKRLLEENKRLEEEKRKQQEIRGQKEEEKRKQVLQSLNQQLSEEPNANLNKPITILRFRTPAGDVLTRRFFVENTLRTVLNFVEANGFSIDCFKILAFHPKQDITQLDREKSIEYLQLYPRLTLYIHRRH